MQPGWTKRDLELATLEKLWNSTKRIVEFKLLRDRFHNLATLIGQDPLRMLNKGRETRRDYLPLGQAFEIALGDLIAVLGVVEGLYGT